MCIRDSKAPCILKEQLAGFYDKHAPGTLNEMQLACLAHDFSSSKKMRNRCNRAFRKKFGESLDEYIVGAAGPTHTGTAPTMPGDSGAHDVFDDALTQERPFGVVAVDARARAVPLPAPKACSGQCCDREVCPAFLSDNRDPQPPWTSLWCRCTLCPPCLI